MKRDMVSIVKWRKLLKGGFSTFQLFNLSTAAFAFALCATANAAEPAEPADSQLTLGEVDLPVYIHEVGGNSRFVQPAVAYPISVVKAPVDPADAVTAVSTKDATMTWELAAWTVGRTLSEQPPDAKLGDFCTDIPFSPDEIDWAATIAANATAVAEGRVVFDTGAANPYERMIFTASGATELTWVRTGGGTISQTYSIGSYSSTRPYRLFATRVDEANSAAFIDLSGKFVKFFGDPNLLRSEYAEKVPGVSNVVYGIDYDASNAKLLTVRYRVNEETGAIDCPQGQFVLAYYDTETKNHMIAHIVVEICPPNVATLNAEVGDCLQPAGGGFGTEQLYAVAAAGLSKDDNDPYSPYLEQYKAAQGEELTDPDHGKLFAVAPTDVTTSSSGMAMPWKADVFWQTEDPMKTRWNFEHDWYLVSWPENPLRVVVAPDDAPQGCPIYIPTNYVAMTDGFKMPATVKATADGYKGTLTLAGERGGKILVKLANQSGNGCPAYLPMELTHYEDKRVASPWIYEWPVGVEIVPRIGLEAGPDARLMSERVDDSLPGYIYEPESRGRNWNPRLYHRPDGDGGLSVDVSLSADEVMENVAGGGDDPYASLESSIYGVNESGSKIQVWWRANFQSPQMEVPVSYPTLVQNYNVTWAATKVPGLLPELTLSSELGSADPNMTAYGKRSMLLVENNSTANVDLGGRGAGIIPSSVTNASVSLSCYVMPDVSDDGETLTTAGRLARWSFGERGNENAAVIDAVLEKDAMNAFQVVVTKTGAEAETFSLNPGEWNVISVAVPEAAFGHGVTATFGAVDWA